MLSTLLDVDDHSKLKLIVDGSIERYRARVASKDFNQEVGVDYQDTFSVVKPITIRIILTFF